MTARDFEAEYNNSRRVRDFPAIEARWDAASQAYRGRVDPATLSEAERALISSTAG